MGKFILFIVSSLLFVSCTIPQRVINQNTIPKEKSTKVIVSEPIPGMDCKCIDNQTMCKEIIKRKFECSNDSSGDLPSEKNQTSNSTDLIVSEPIPGANCNCIDRQTNCKEVAKRKYSCKSK